jgi:hypothetical protein
MPGTTSVNNRPATAGIVDMLLKTQSPLAEHTHRSMASADILNLWGLAEAVRER